MTFVLIGISAHPVWIGLILSYLVGYKLGMHADHRLLQLFTGVGAQCGGRCNGRTT